MKRKNKFKSFWLGVWTRIHNYILIKRFPFLKPSLGYGTDMEWHRKGYKYRYESTWLDNVPNGWRKLALSLCKELKQIIKEDHLENYVISQVKEKFGELCWYYEGGNDRIRDVTQKYEILSRNVCIYCGKSPTTHITKGWITYLCEDCAKKRDPKTITEKKNGIQL